MNWKKNLAIFGLAMAASTFAADKYEAEAATIDNSALEDPDWAAVAATDANASGGKIVKLNGGNLVFENVEVPSAGNYTVTIHYKNNNETDKTNDLVVGSASTAIVFPITGKGVYDDVSATIKMVAGKNTVSIKKSWGWVDVDYITVEAYEGKKYTLCNAPVTADATPSAQKLYNFLVNNFGKKTISGVMTGNMEKYTEGDFTQHEDVQVVYTASGKYPALVGIDLMNATGAQADQDWFKSYTAKGLDIAQDVWKKGGIPAITWHWRPGSEVEFYTSKGNASSYTEFDFTKAFVKGSTSWDTLSTEYKTLAGDIDKIASLLLPLQEAGVAAIFRPLHESGGTWFWWSTHTGAQFAALYRLVYERMVFKNGVKNLVWVFNPQDASKISWTPGENYYDVLSVDIYNKANDYQSNSGVFVDFTEKGSATKVLALSENGPIPDVKSMYEDGATWSWWMPWYDSWGDAEHKYISQTAATVWQSNMADERIISLDKMPGWDAYSEANAGTKTCATSTESAKYDADTSKASETTSSYAMGINLVLDSTVLINSTKLTGIATTKKISMEINNLGKGGEAEDGGVWIGLAFVRNGMDDKEWTWEMSTDTTCWISAGQKATCEFEVENYLSNGSLVPMDKDKLFSMNIMIGGNKGFKGVVVFDNITTEEGILINGFDKKADLFAKSEAKDTQISNIELVNEDGSPISTTAIKSIAKVASASKFSVAGNRAMLTSAAAGQVSVDVFSMSGKRVATLFRGNLNAGTHSFDMSDLSKGQYIVRVKGAGLAATQPVMIK